MTSPPAFKEVLSLNAAGRYVEALEKLDALPDTGIHLWLRGWALHHLGRTAEAHASMQAAQILLEGNNLGRMWMDWAVLFGHERRFARAYDLHLQAWQLLQGDQVMRPQLLYNLGWQHLSRLQLEQARARLFEAMEAGERATGLGALERVITRMGVSTLERLTGNPRAALERARWAQEVADGHRYGSMPFRAEAQAHRHLGDLKRARDIQAHSVTLARGDTYQASERLMLGLIDRQLGRVVPLDSLRAGAMPLDVLRLDLHLADEARVAGREEEALDRLRAVVAHDEPYPLRDEAPALGELYVLGRQAGLTLPVWALAPSRREAALRTLGVPGLSVNGMEVVGATGRAFPLLVYVALYGQTSLDVLGEELFPGLDATQVRSRVRSALPVIARWLGDREALTLQGTLVVPSGDWKWTVDAREVLAGKGRARGAFLPGVYTGWTGRMQELLDTQDRAAS